MAALRRYGERVFERVGREPSGDPLHPIIQLERRGGIPRNSFINAGAIAVSGLLAAAETPAGEEARLLALARAAAGDEPIQIDEEVARSEAETGHRDLAHFLPAARSSTASTMLCNSTFASAASP